MINPYNILCFKKKEIKMRIGLKKGLSIIKNTPALK